VSRAVFFCLERGADGQKFARRQKSPAEAAGRA
jgi:hypothetical protein